MTGMISKDFDYSKKEDRLKAKAALLVEYGNRAKFCTIPFPNGQRRMITNLSNDELIFALNVLEEIDRRIMSGQRQ